MSNRQFFKRRSFIFLLIGLLIGTIPSALFVAAQSGTLTTPTISAGPVPGAATYTVFYENSYYYYKDKYGAISAGSTNLTATLNTVISTVSATGGEVKLALNGSYSINGTIAMKGNVWLHGLGMNITMLRVPNAMDTNAIQVSSSATPTNGVIISDLGLDGNHAGQGAATWGNGIELIDTANAHVYNCLIKEFQGYGARCYGSASSSSGTIFDNLWLLNCCSNGLTIGGSGGHAQVSIATNCYVEGSSDVGITIMGDNCIVSNCVAKNIQGATGEGQANSGWAFAIESGSDNMIKDCNIIDVDVGIGISAPNNVVEGCKGMACDENLVRVYASGTGAIVKNNVVLDAVQDGIQVDDDNVKIEGNVILGATNVAINLAATAQGIWVAHNDLLGSAANMGIAGGATVTYGHNRWVNGTYGSPP